MSNSTPLSPSVSIATAYFVSAKQVVLRYSQALQPDCNQTGIDQTATPDPSPSR
jgi:hypothetical protein